MTRREIRREMMKYKATLFCFLFVNMHVAFGFSTCLLTIKKTTKLFPTANYMIEQISLKLIKN